MANYYVVDEWKDFIEKSGETELAEILEETAAEELIAAKDSIPEHFICESGLDKFGSKEELLGNRDRLLEISAYFSDKSISSNTDAADGLLTLNVHLTNVGLFLTVIMIDLIATLHHITGGLPMQLNVNVGDYYSDPIAEAFSQMASLFPDIVSCNVEADDTAEDEERDDGRSDDAPFEDEWTICLDRMVKDYDEHSTPAYYTDIITMMLLGIAKSVSAQFPAVFDADSENEIPFNFMCVQKKDGSRYLPLLTRPTTRCANTVKVSLLRALSVLEDDELYGLTINPTEENVVIHKNVLLAAIKLYEAGAERGKML